MKGVLLNQLYMLDVKTKILLSLAFVLIVLSVATTYYRYIVLRDFEIVNDLDEADLEE